MKKTTNLFCAIALIVLPVFGAMAQNPTIYKGWTALPDSPTHLEVSWSTLKCSSTSNDEIRLLVFNESGDAQTANFTITISEQGQNDVTHTVSNLNLTGGETIIANCGSTAPSSFSLDVPAGFDPNTLTISITYN